MTPEALIASIVNFARFLRRERFRVGLRETSDAALIAGLGFMVEEQRFRDALRSLFCVSKDEWSRFEDLFERFWYGRRAELPGRPDPKGTTTMRLPDKPLLGTGSKSKESDDQDGRSTTGASELERLSRTDFSEVAPEDARELEKLVLRLGLRMRVRLDRRDRPKLQRSRIDLRRTIRRSIGYGGDPVDLRYRGPRRRKPRLVALLDISGSMDQYSFFLLRFLYTMQRHFDRVEAFVFSTRLDRVTDALRTKRFADAIPSVTLQAKAWSSGTRIGESLADFNDHYADRILTDDCFIFMLSDGLDTGDPELLGRELRRLKGSGRKLIWLNPLLGMKNYEPVARGMREALPLADAFVPAHNLESLKLLESELRYV